MSNEDPSKDSPKSQEDVQSEEVDPSSGSQSNEDPSNKDNLKTLDLTNERSLTDEVGVVEVVELEDKTLDLTNERPSTGTPVAQRALAEPEGREHTRTYLALGFLGLLVTTVVGALFFIGTNKLEADTLIQSILPTVVALAGTAMGFYFGQSTGNSEELNKQLLTGKAQSGIQTNKNLTSIQSEKNLTSGENPVGG